MKKFLALFVALCTFAAVSAADIPGNQDLKQDTRIVTEFQQVVVTADFNIKLDYAISPKVMVEAESNLLPYIITEVKGKTLNIYVEKKTRLAPNYPITITLSTSMLNKLQFKGGGNITADGIPSDKMDLSLAGKGQCNITNLKTGSLKIAATGNFEVNMKDVVCSSAVKISMSDNVTGNINNFTAPKVEVEANSLEGSRWGSLQTDALTLKVNNAGKMDFTGFAGKDVNVTMTSTGAITMAGTARNVNITASNASKFDALNLAAEKAKVVNNGTGDLGVAASAGLDVTITSSGSVMFKGDLKISFTSNGSGQLIKKK